MATVGHVRVGWFRTLELRMFTGEIVANDKGALSIRNSGGEGWTLEGAVRRLVPMSVGDRMSLFSGVRSGKESDWIAGVNHTKGGALTVIPQPFNRLIVPPGYNLMGIVAIFAGVFGVFALLSGSPQSILLLAFTGGFLLWIRSRQNALKRAIRAAAAKATDEPLVNQPPVTPAAPADPNEIRI